MKRRTIFLFPGLGADARIFDEIAKDLPDVVVPPWIPPLPREPVRDYVKRLAETLPPCDERLIGGMSFGGIVAVELADFLGEDRCVLISSIPNRGALPWHLRALLPIGSRLPLPAVRFVRFLARLLRDGFSWALPRHRKSFVTQFSDSDPEFVRWAVSAIEGWDRMETPSLDVKQVHGSWDHVFPRWRVPSATFLPWAGHLMALTHGPEIARFVRSVREPDSSPHAAPEGQ